MQKERNYSTEIKEVNNLIADKQVVFPENANVIINDLQLDSTEKDILCNLSKREIIFIDPDIYSKELIGLLPKNILQDPSTSILYPEKGGLIVRESANLAGVMQYSIPAKRDIVNSSPSVDIPEQLLVNLLNGNTTNILVLDDVIVTGSTLNAIRNEVYELTDVTDDLNYNQSIRFTWKTIATKRLPIKWYAGALMVSSRPGDQENNLAGFERTFTPILYKGQSGQTPVNSISTWVFDKDKGDIVLSNYAKKYSINPDEFCYFIKSLKRR